MDPIHLFIEKGRFGTKGADTQFQVARSIFVSLERLYATCQQSCFFKQFDCIAESIFDRR